MVTKTSWTILLIAGFVITYFILILYTDISKLQATFSEIETNYLLVGIGFWFIALIPRLIRWHYFLKEIHNKIPFSANVLYYLVGLSLTITPGRMGELIRSPLIKRDFGISISKTASVVFVERFFDLIGLLSLMSISFIFVAFDNTLVIAPLALLAIMIIIFKNKKLLTKLTTKISKLPFLKNVGLNIQESYDTVTKLMKLKFILFGSLTALISYWFDVLGVYYIIQSLHGQISLPEVSIALPASLFIATLSLIPGGIGVFEGGMIGLLIFYGLSYQIALSTTILTRIFRTGVFSVVGLISLKLIQTNVQKSNYFYILNEWVGYFIKQHGVLNTLKGIFLYHYRILKLLKIDVSKEHHVVINECPLILIPNDKGISEELLLFKTHEPFSTKALRSELNEGMVCLDIGANLGYYATMESKAVGGSGHVIAIEPSPTNFSYLKRNMELQKTSNYELFNFAVGDKDGSVNFLISKKSNLSKVVSEEEKIPDGCEIINIPLTTLDKFVYEKQLNRLDLIRMDVEGYELQILEGAKQIIKKFKPMMQIEIHTKILGKQNLKKVLLDLKNFGYEIKFFIAREIDFAYLGNEKNIRTPSFDKLIKESEEEVLPRNFILVINIPKK